MCVCFRRRNFKLQTSVILKRFTVLEIGSKRFKSGQNEGDEDLLREEQEVDTLKMKQVSMGIAGVNFVCNASLQQSK